jgi:hypothetical protein
MALGDLWLEYSYGWSFWPLVSISPPYSWVEGTSVGAEWSGLAYSLQQPLQLGWSGSIVH